MAGLRQVEPGWLNRSVERAQTAMRAQHAPQYYVDLGYPVTLPISHAEASELYRTLNNRFRAWTGCDLRGFEPSPQPRSDKEGG